MDEANLRKTSVRPRKEQGLFAHRRTVLGQHAGWPVKLPHFSGGMEKYFDRSLYSFGTAKLVRKHGKYFLHIPVTSDVPESLCSDICQVVGVDRGINFIVATYDSKRKSGFVSGKAI